MSTTSKFSAQDIVRIMRLHDACKDKRHSVMDRMLFCQAVESLVAERDRLKAALEAIATLDHTRPLIDARSIARAALKGHP